MNRRDFIETLIGGSLAPVASALPVLPAASTPKPGWPSSMQEAIDQALGYYPGSPGANGDKSDRGSH